MRTLDLDMCSGNRLDAILHDNKWCADYPELSCIYREEQLIKKMKEISMGEHGQVSVGCPACKKGKDAKTSLQQPVDVALTLKYTNPVIIAGIPTERGTDSAVVRIQVSRHISYTQLGCAAMSRTEPISRRASKVCMAICGRTCASSASASREDQTLATTGWARAQFSPTKTRTHSAQWVSRSSPTAPVTPHGASRCISKSPNATMDTTQQRPSPGLRWKPVLTALFRSAHRIPVHCICFAYTVLLKPGHVLLQGKSFQAGTVGVQGGGWESVSFHIPFPDVTKNTGVAVLSQLQVHSTSQPYYMTLAWSTELTLGSLLRCRQPMTPSLLRRARSLWIRQAFN